MCFLKQLYFNGSMGFLSMKNSKRIKTQNTILRHFYSKFIAFKCANIMNLQIAINHEKNNLFIAILHIIFDDGSI